MTEQRQRVVRYVDTSVVLNLLNFPGRSENRESVLQEFQRIVREKQTLILPLTSIVETGNHIAQLSNGQDRRRVAVAFSELLRKTADRKIPWTLDKLSMERDDLLYYADHFPKYAIREVGLGDLSIIHEFNRYVTNLRAASVFNVKVFIWTLDTHLAGYTTEI
jgi:hypothetical protein